MRRVYSYGESKDKTITSIVFISSPWVVADTIKSAFEKRHSHSSVLGLADSVESIVFIVIPQRKITMKLTNLSKTICASAFAVSVAALPLSLPVSAQTNPVDTDTNRTVTVQEDDGFDWGWLGLLGLLGLAGLGGRNKNRDTVAYRDPNVTETGTTGTTIR